MCVFITFDGEMAEEMFALLVIDMQKYFASIGEGLVAELNATTSACRERKIPVVFTQHGHKMVDLDSGALGRFWGLEDMIKYGSEDWQLIPQLNVCSSDIIIDEKRRYDAFHGTPLQDILHQLAVNTVVICGVVTNLCCETTARSAFVRDFNVVFLSDGTCSYSQEMHKASLMNIEYGFGKVLKCAEFRQTL